MADRFIGFSPLAPGFFERLAVNNNKAWFERKGATYQTYTARLLFPQLPYQSRINAVTPAVLIL
jgi:hypothetical protein